MNFYTNNKKRKLNTDSDEENETINSNMNISTKGNNIYFYESVYDTQILELINQINDLKHKLKYHASLFNFEPIIHLHLYSYGGDAFMGLSMYDFITNCDIDIYTYIDGMIASAATFIYLAGKKRFMTPNSTVLIHQISTSFWGKFEDLKDECKNTTELMKIVRNLYSQNTSMKKKQIDEILKRELYLTSDECSKINFSTNNVSTNN
tara:strand:- start:588 stop:1208 length:621 start_codon:yes stop_codon:yes gene_type:complete